MKHRWLWTHELAKQNNWCGTYTFLYTEKQKSWGYVAQRKRSTHFGVLKQGSAQSKERNFISAVRQKSCFMVEQPTSNFISFSVQNVQPRSWSRSHALFTNYRLFTLKVDFSARKKNILSRIMQTEHLHLQSKWSLAWFSGCGFQVYVQ